MKLYYTLTTLDPVIISQSNSTTNNHQGLDYIPGSAILGALASQHYCQLTEQQSWQAFHNGQIKFSPCYPVAKDQLCLPIPASWHVLKGDNEKSDNQLNTDVISNQSATLFKRPEGKQFKQIRSGFFGPQGQLSDVKVGQVTKTALDATTGTAKDSQLFSYSYIDSGQTFAGWIDIEEDNNELTNLFNQNLNGQLRIGRSRNIEFGRVQLALIPAPKSTVPTNNELTLTLWCLSDCECLDSQGLATLTPDLNSLIDNAHGTLKVERSFIRANRISRYNAKRQGYDSEQHLIAKGSVLVYQLTQPLTDDQLSQLEQSGIGINQQQGLGWVSINPPWASNANGELKEITAPWFNALTMPAVKVNTVSTIPSSPLIKWLGQQVERQASMATQRDKVNQIMKNIIGAYLSARNYNHIPPAYPTGPSSNQWRRLDTLLKTNPTQWQQAAFSDSNNAICKAQNDPTGWGLTWHNGEREVNFVEFLNPILKDLDPATLLACLEAICKDDLSTYAGLKQQAKRFNIDYFNASSKELSHE